eukprot:10033150-Heterocapsa_arctica.AAC.1
MHSSALGPGMRASPTLMPTYGPFLRMLPALASGGMMATTMNPSIAHASRFPADLRAEVVD